MHSLNIIKSYSMKHIGMVQQTIATRELTSLGLFRRARFFALIFAFHERFAKLIGPNDPRGRPDVRN